MVTYHTDDLREPTIPVTVTITRVRPSWRGIIGTAILSGGLVAITLSMLYTATDTAVAPCTTEDSTDCYWDATQGNGEGTSFVDVEGVAYYPEDAACTDALASYRADYDNAVALAANAESTGTVLHGFATDTLAAYSDRLEAISRTC